MEISIIGVGFVGSAMKMSFEIKGNKVFAYDKYKDLNTFEECLNTKIMFLCLPTLFNENTKQYEKGPIFEICDKLSKHNYQGIVVIKSTIEPGATINLIAQFPLLKFLHNPEFLTAATAFKDFHNQKHIVLGTTKNISQKNLNTLTEFYKFNYPEAEISICNSTESESMKSFVNCFYAVKVQFFNEIYLHCFNSGCDYQKVKSLMLKNGWINPMHTNVPGPDGKLSYGGYCFPKDTNALLNDMKKKNTPCHVLEATIKERNIMRKDENNVIKKDTVNKQKKYS
jgi:UDPglucose 6-dehydrogenase